jgi:hypothetical protein
LQSGTADGRLLGNDLPTAIIYNDRYI